METSQSLNVVNFRSVITNYTSYLLQQLISIPFLIDKLNAIYDFEKKRYKTFVASNNLNTDGTGESGEPTAASSITIPLDKISEYDEIYNNLHSIYNISCSLLDTQFVDSVTKFDVFLQNIMRCIYKCHPDIVKNSEKNLTYKILDELNSIDSAKEYIIESILDEIFRGSHTDMLVHLNKITKVDVEKDLNPLFKQLIEITERRNVYIHCNGNASKQYINVCTQNKVPVTVNEGDKLTIGKEYYINTIKGLIDLSMKIGYIIWTKQERSEQRLADEYLDDFCNTLMKQELYDNCISIVQYLLSHKENRMNNAMKQNLKLYNVLAYKKSSNTAKVAEELNGDWSSVSPKVKLKLLILKDDIPSAIQQMKHIGNDPTEISEEDYTKSVIFADIIGNPDFQAAFKEIYGHDLSYIRNVL